jgi:hypothetical protein
MDADDIAYPERLIIQKEFLDRNPMIGVVGTSISILDTGEVIKYPQTDSEIKITLLDHAPFAHPTVMYRTDVVKTSKYDSRYTHAEDYALWVALSRKTRFANIDQPLLYYRRHPGQISSIYSADQKKSRTLIIEDYLKHLVGESLSELDIRNHFSFLGISKWSDTRAIRSWVDKLRHVGLDSHYWEIEDFERFVSDILFYRLDQRLMSKISRRLNRMLGIVRALRIEE